MGLRAGLPLFCLVCVGCQLLPLNPEVESEAMGLWQQGQAAMRAGQPETAIAWYQQSLSVDPALAQNHVSLAAAYLEIGKDAEACTQLAQFIETHPEQCVIRTHYAELLMRLRRPREARAELESILAALQDRGGDALHDMIHGHSRLMELAEAEEDDYAAHLHRGIGLYLLAREPEDAISSEGLLCKAAGELNTARTLRPTEARPSWYLFLVWSRLGQQQPARRCLNETSDAAPFSYLTPAEQRSLQLASLFNLPPSTPAGSSGR